MKVKIVDSESTRMASLVKRVGKVIEDEPKKHISWYIGRISIYHRSNFIAPIHKEIVIRNSFEGKNNDVVILSIRVYKERAMKIAKNIAEEINFDTITRCY